METSRRSTAAERDEARLHASETLRPEDLIVAVKASWSRHAATHEPTEEHRVQWALTDVLSSCIVEFYRMDGAAGQDQRVSGA